MSSRFLLRGAVPAALGLAAVLTIGVTTGFGGHQTAGSSAPVVASTVPATPGSSGGPSTQAPNPSSSTNSSSLPATGAEDFTGLQPNARNMKVAILSPADQTKVDASFVNVQVLTSGFVPRADMVGKGAQEGQGHYDLYLDNTLINLFESPAIQLSMQNVSPGKHTITAVPAQNDNREIKQNAVTVSFQYEPTSPIPQIPAANFGSAPTIRILSPVPDSTVNGLMDVVVGVTGLNLDGSLMGKSNIAGYGHWYLALDSLPHIDGSGLPGNLLGFSSTRGLQFPTAGLVRGSIHTLYAVLVNDDHTSFNPTSVDQVQVRIG